MALVTLVVIGHAWTLLPDEGITEHLYDFLYAWHMPAFVIVTGYLSRSFSYAPARLGQLVRTVAVPYVVFECAMALFRVHVGGEQLEDLFADPHWPMWFLAALFCWRLLTPVLRPMTGGLVVAVAASVAAGLWAGDTLDLARVLGLLPFFVLGLTMRREQIDRLAGPRVRTAAAAALGIAFVAAAFVAEPLSTEWLYWRSSYDAMDVTVWQGLAGRAGVLVVAAVLALSALALIPRSHRWFTPLGAASLVVYLCHGFFVKAAQYAGAGGLVEADEITAFVIVTGAAVLLALALAATPVSRRLNSLVDPISTATADTPGIIEPHHHRVRTEHRLALTHRHPTRHS